MKTARSLFTIIGLSALTLQVSLGDQQSGQPLAKGSAKNQITPDFPGDNTHSKVANKNQADVIYPRLGEHVRPFEKSSQTGPTQNGMLPAHGVLAAHRVFPAHGMLPANGVQPAHHPELNHPKPIANNHQVLGQKPVDNFQTKLPSVYDLHPTVLNPASTAVAKEELLVNRTKNPQVELTKRLPATNEANASLPGVVHNREGSTAAIGQRMPSSAKTSTAALNGTGIKLKP